ncbi:enoyl-CoA hydratase/isomerase family protein [Necator americanus]|uniref:Ethylmalonyl-CoA decarboxylase n=1 Tax=Necator americanus TaxID=51031 RepID=W2TPB0_NECAM|nr:enoyl-CoA hydratase/isomerase family protein [Necator americanus]ETN83920.1 enoyl-CoA hydratase/isomerase family protein [Necator americanus]
MANCLLRLKLGRHHYLLKRAINSNKFNPELAKTLHRWTGGAVDLTSSGGIARLMLNRPEKSNCLSGEMMIQFRQKTEELSTFSDCGVLIVEGIGRSFCSGADLGLINEVPLGPMTALMFQISSSSLGCAMFHYMAGTLSKIHSSPLVSIARLHGHCLGGGSEIASSCDLRFAHKDAKIGFLQSRMGIVPSWGGATYLPTIVGRSRALYLMTTAPILTSQEAKEIGYVDVVYNEEEEFQELVSCMLRNGEDVCKAQKAMLKALTQGEDAQDGKVIPPV